MPKRESYTACDRQRMLEQARTATPSQRKATADACDRRAEMLGPGGKVEWLPLAESWRADAAAIRGMGVS